MKCLIILLMLAGFTTAAQDYETLITRHREKYKADFLTDKRSPLNAEDIPNLRFFTADSTYRVVADAEILIGQQPFKMLTYTGQSIEYIKYALLKFNLNGQLYRLFVYRNTAKAKLPSHENYLFLPFTDDTNGNGTYPGGRYIDLHTYNIQNSRVEIDFNKAYNPYCAYSDRYMCPKPPTENYLPLSIEAGEKQFAGDKKH